MIREEGLTLARPHGRRVLLIDDDRWVRALFTDVLAAMGCEVDTAASGEEGLTLLARGGYQLVITDLEMGSVGGLAVADAARRGPGGVPVIIMTGSTDRLDGHRSRRHGFTVLTKPMRLTDFQVAVRHALGAEGGAVN